MPQTRHIEMQPPLGGVHKGFAFQAQPPFTSVDALNVLPTDPLLGRRRIGSRYGVAKHNARQFGGGAPMRVLARMVDLFGRPILFNVTNGVGESESVAGTWPGTTIFSGMNPTGRVCVATLGNRLYMAQKGMPQPFFFDGSTGGGGGFGNTPVEAVTLGQVPTNCSIVASAFGRLIFAGDTGGTGAPRTVYVSRVRVANDFDYAETDDDAAYSETIEPQGNENDALTAIIPWYGDYCLYLFKSSCVLQLGDRGNGNGQYYTTSVRIGCLDAMSWCYGPNNVVYFLSKEGLASMSPSNPRGEPQLLSRDKLPDDLLQVDPTQYEVVMAWDARLGGVRIALTRTSGGGSTGQWFYDPENGGYWPLEYDSACDPFCVCYYPELSTTNSSLLWGTRNGYVRYDTPEAEDDDGTDFESYVYLGPVKLGDGLTNGLVNRLGAALDKTEVNLMTEADVLLTTENDVQLTTEATTSGAANYALYVGSSAQEAYQSSAAFSAALSGGRNRNHLPRRRGVVGYLKMYGTAGTRWALESLTMEVVSGGRFR
jgi:hypothetical protein